MERDIDVELLAKARALGPVICEHAAQAEHERQLAREVVLTLESAGLTRMFLPRSLGGLEADPITVLRVMETIAGFDSAAAWLLMVANSPAWFAARLPAETVEEMYRDAAAGLATTAFQPPVEGRAVAGGYRLTGRRGFASGIHAARWLCLTAIIKDGDQPRIVDGRPEIVFAVMPTSSVEIIDTWYGLGLRGSDSNDVAVRDLFVPARWTCPLVPPFEANRHYRAPLYRMPAMAAIVLATFPAIALAVARGAVDEARALCARKVPMGSAVVLRDRGVAQATLGRAEAMLRAARALVYETMTETWERTLAGEQHTLSQKAGLMLAATHAAQTGAEVTDMMFGLGGASSVFVGQRLERLFRDAQVIRQHGFVCASRYETAAQPDLGVDPDVPLVHF
jgi:alkylation response protein AidB-like acyl-CoA dehydrogenase